MLGRARAPARGRQHTASAQEGGRVGVLLGDGHVLGRICMCYVYDDSYTHAGEPVTMSVNIRVSCARCERADRRSVARSELPGRTWHPIEGGFLADFIQMMLHQNQYQSVLMLEGVIVKAANYQSMLYT